MDLKLVLRFLPILLLSLLAACSLPTGTPVQPVAPTPTPLLALPAPLASLPPLPTVPLPTISLPTLSLPTLAPLASAAPRPTLPPSQGAALVVFPPYDSPFGFLLGAVQDGRWIEAPAAADQLKDGQSYALYDSKGRLGQAAGKAPSKVEVCRSFYDIQLPHETGAVLALGGSWNALPRQPLEIAPDSPTYRQVVADFLASRQVAAPEVNIERILRADLDGDGVEEVVLAASRFAEPTGHSISPGDYTLVLLRRVRGAAAETVPVAAEIHTQAAELGFPDRYGLAGLFDLNGDGKLEILVALGGWEKTGARLYELSAAGPKLVLEARCP